MIGPVVTVHGTCDPRFAALHAAFAENFLADGEVGAAVAVELDGELVVDLWAGHTDLERRHEWQAGTLVNVFSVGKAATSVCVHHLVQRGLLDVDQPVRHYWPEFAAAGKDAVTVRMLLSHRAGLPAIRAPLPDEAVFEWATMTGHLAAETPWWPPGSAHGYHTNTFGFLVGEVVRRVSGDTVGQYLRDHVSGPLGIEFYIGLPADLDHRVAPFLGYDAAPRQDDDAAAVAQPLDEHQLMVAKTYANPRTLSGLGVVNSRRWRAAEVPSTNGHSHARAVAQLMGGLARHTILEAAVLEQATEEQSAGTDLILGRPSRFGLGFQLTQPERPMGPSPRAFGHFGAGGSVGFADPDTGLGFGYTMGMMGPRWQNPKNRRLIAALYAGL